MGVRGATTPHTSYSQKKGELVNKELWRDQIIESILDIRNVSDASEDQCLSLLVGMTDIRVRDTIMWELTTNNHGLGNLMTACYKATRLTDDENAVINCNDESISVKDTIAPLYTFIAIQYWLKEDTEYARKFLDHGLESDPSYTLANLIDKALIDEMPFTFWKKVMNGLSRDECRFGSN